MSGATRSLLRTRKSHEHSRVTFVELFFDLVFVFAVTQLSHSMLEHLTIAGALQTLLLFMAVWWVWIFTSWATNWLDPDRIPVRLMLFVLMLAGLILSTSIPKAFEDRGLAFVGAYVAMQVGRSLFTMWCMRSHPQDGYRNFLRISIWFVFSGLFWLAGAFTEGQARFALWVVALAVEYTGPSAAFWCPGLGRSKVSEWDVEGGHLAERCGLFIIIALGESILVTGATFANLAWNASTIAAFLVAFVASVAMWWIYFNVGAERASDTIAGSDDPGRFARLSYTYLHLPLVAGIIVTAVGDELVLVHPADHTDLKTMLVVIGGPALYLLGNLLFKRSIGGSFALSHTIGLILLIVFAPAYLVLSPLALSAGTTLILILVAAWETLSLRPSVPIPDESIVVADSGSH